MPLVFGTFKKSDCLVKITWNMFQKVTEAIENNDPEMSRGKLKRNELARNWKEIQMYWTGGQAKQIWKSKNYLE